MAWAGIGRAAIWRILSWLWSRIISIWFFSLSMLWSRSILSSGCISIASFWLSHLWLSLTSYLCPDGLFSLSDSLLVLWSLAGWVGCFSICLVFWKVKVLLLLFLLAFFLSSSFISMLWLRMFSFVFLFLWLPPCSFLAWSFYLHFLFFAVSLPGVVLWTHLFELYVSID